MTLHVTLFFIGLLTMIQVLLSVIVIKHRRTHKIAFETGGDKDMVRKVRAHANFTETVPIALIAMGGAEITGLAPVWLWIGGAGLVLARLLHAVALIGRQHKLRPAGMGLTLTVLVVFAAYDMIAAFH